MLLFALKPPYLSLYNACRAHAVRAVRMLCTHAPMICRLWGFSYLES